jgi:farnesyl-diphosphate farnesyltransferase
MVIYSHRPPDDHGLHTLMNLDDLYRYCYFVAGTVGHLLTELFEIAAREALDMSARRVMRANAEAFGIGLQLVNIIKDIASDRRRGWSFIPRGFISEDAFNPSAAPNIRREALLALAPVFERAHSCLDRGLVYVLAVPRTQRPIRSFLTLPLWMGVRTLRCADGNAAIFDEDQRVAISRREVETLLHSCVEHAGDDNAVRQIYGRLRSSQTAVGS